MLTDNMIAIYNHYLELEMRLREPTVYNNPKLSAQCEQEMREIEPIVSAVKKLIEIRQNINDLISSMDDPDPEWKKLALESIPELKEEEARLTREIQVLLLPKDPNDGKNVIMEIRGGVGGEEGMLFAHDLFRMYSMYADSQGWKIDVANVNQTELGGIKEISFVVEGEGAYSRLKFEAGTHRVQRVPVTESGGRIHTSAATVAVLPQIEETDFKINPNDLRIDTYRSSGAGGQHINKTESAIRITHIPTGMVVECQDERSQYKNKDRAMQILRSRLYEAQQAEKDAAVAAERKSQVGSGDRSQRIRTYNFPQNRVTDHRLGSEAKRFNLSNVMNGDLNPIIDALITNDQAKKLIDRGDKNVDKADK